LSLFRRVLGLDVPAGSDASLSSGAPLDPNRPLPSLPAAETESVRRIAARLAELPPARARFVAAFAYLLARAANADLVVTDAERAEVARLVAEVGGLDAATADVVAELARTRVDDFGATEDFLVTREFRAISGMDDRERLLRCCLLVMAADDEIVADEAWLINRIAEGLDIERPDLNRIRDEFTDRYAAVRAIRDARPPQA
jgi:uncharacterized tellurite resistance protein B-like protein